LTIGRILLENGGFEEVLQMTGQALDEMPGTRFPVSLPDLLELQGRALLGLGQPEAAERLLVQALEKARQFGSRWRQPFLLASLVSLAESRGEKDLADVRRSEGREQVLYLESQIDSPELRASFQDLPEIQALMG
jgi:tetratricopeptide (TPR) repeat protein